MSLKLAPPPETSQIGPFVLACFAFLILAQGLMYIFKPEQTGRAMTTPKHEIQRIGYIITVVSVGLLYISYLWWMNP